MKTDKPSCIFCQSTQLYNVSKTQFRCATCHKTFSHAKYATTRAILECFIHDKSALECSKELSLNYATVTKLYQKCRLCIASYLETLSQEHTKSFTQYDEYYFLPTKKRGNPQYLFDSIGILGMLYDDYVYTLLLPDQFAHVKHLEDDSIEKITYARYLSHTKVAHFESFETPLNHFWRYLERWMEHFKGVNRENFIYYLKEAEFKFNHSKEEQYTILARYTLL